MNCFQQLVGFILAIPQRGGQLINVSGFRAQIDLCLRARDYHSWEVAEQLVELFDVSVLKSKWPLTFITLQCHHTECRSRTLIGFPLIWLTESAEYRSASESAQAVCLKLHLALSLWDLKLVKPLLGHRIIKKARLYLSSDVRSWHNIFQLLALQSLYLSAGVILSILFCSLSFLTGLLSVSSLWVNLERSTHHFLMLLIQTII